MTKKEMINRLRHLQAQIRRHLPSWAGGRFTVGNVSYEMLDDHAIADLLSFYEIPSTPVKREQYKTILQDRSRLCLGLYLDGDLVAALWISRQWQSLGIPGYWIGGARVCPGLRGRGLGQLLIHYCSVEAGRLGIDRVYANVRVENTPSLGALTASGFTEISKPDWERLLSNQLGEEQVILISAPIESSL